MRCSECKELKSYAELTNIASVGEKAEWVCEDCLGEALEAMKKLPGAEDLEWDDERKKWIIKNK